MLIDGLNLIFRLYHTMPALGYSGQSTNVVLGFIKSINSFIKDFYPRSLAVCWDGKGGKYRRKEIYPPYKEGRAKLTTEQLDDIFSQVELSKEYLSLGGIGSVEIAGWEADDLLVGVTDWAKEAGLVSCIVTTDGDLQQAIDPAVYWYNPMSNTLHTVESFRAKFGFDSQAVVDYKILMGDSSDNISGISGIGKKTAADILSKYGTLKNFLENGDFKGRLAVFENPETLVEIERLRKIIDIRCLQQEEVVEGAVQLWYAQEPRPNLDELYKYFLRLGMQSLSSPEGFREVSGLLSTLRTEVVLDALY